MTTILKYINKFFIQLSLLYSVFIFFNFYYSFLNIKIKLSIPFQKNKIYKFRKKKLNQTQFCVAAKTSPDECQHPEGKITQQV